MKRVTQGGDINFNVADVKGLGDNYAFRFYTTDSCKYIVKVDGDAVDDIIRLEWDELKTLGDGVLNYCGENLEPDEEYSDATFNRTFGGTTQWYIVTSCSGGGGGSSEEISELSDRLDAEIARSSAQDTQHNNLIAANTHEIHRLGDRLYTDTYTKEEVDQKIAEAEMGGELPESIVIDPNYVHTDNNFTTNEQTKLQNLPTADELTQQLGDKANDNAVVKSISVNGGTAQTPQNGNVNIQVQGTEGKSAYQSYYDTTSDNPKMTEVQWAAAVLRSAYRSYLATTSDNPVMTETQWVASLKGPKGDTGNTQLLDPTTFDPITQIINDLVTGGQTDALSAEMGKELKAQIDALEDTVEELDEGAGYDISVTETAIVFTSRNMPHVSVGEVGNHNVSCKAGNTATTSFYVSGRRLTSAIQIAVSDPTNWSVSPVSISPTDGKVALTLITITYHPASGATADTTHNCNVDVSSGNTTFETIAMVGTVAAAPSITLSLSSATITTTQDTPATATLNVKGAALEGEITLAISGTGFSLSTNLVAKADAESAAGADVTVTFDGSANGSATITANSTNATEATVSVEGKIPTPLAEGSYFIVPASNGNGSLRYTVLSDGNVSVKSNSGISSTTDNPLVIPATVNDSDATTVYNSGGTRISASGLSYNVTTVASTGFKNITALKAIELPDGLKKIDADAFMNCRVENLIIPSSVNNIPYRWVFRDNPSLKKIEFKGSVHLINDLFINDTSLMTVILNGNTVGNHAFNGCTQFEATSGDKPVVINRKTTGYQYRINATITPFPQNTTTGKVWAKLYVPDVSGYVNNNAATYWGCFDEVLDISEYTE